MDWSQIDVLSIGLWDPAACMTIHGKSWALSLCGAAWKTMLPQQAPTTPSITADAAARRQASLLPTTAALAYHGAADTVTDHTGSSDGGRRSNESSTRLDTKHIHTRHGRTSRPRPRRRALSTIHSFDPAPPRAPHGPRPSWPRDPISAAKEDRKKMWGIFDEAGIFAAACRHGLVLWVIDMVCSGEL